MNEKPEIPAPTEAVRTMMSDLIQETRTLTRLLPFRDRAVLLRELVKAVRDTVKFDPLIGGNAPGGNLWELDAMGEISNEAERYYYKALEVIRDREPLTVHGDSPVL